MLTIQTTAVRYTLVPGVSTFSITFGYWDKGQIVALLTGEEGDLTVLTLGTDYTLTDPDGVSGTLTKVSDWGDATKLTIMRAVPVTQERDLINGQVLDAEEVEQAFDKVTAILQEHKEKLSRAFLFSEDEEGSDISLPGKAKRQGSGYGSILGFDGTGDVAIVRDLKEFDDDVAAAIAAAAAASSSETNAANSATKAGKWAEEAENVPVETGKYSAKHHAAKAKASETAAAASALAAAGSKADAYDSELAAAGSKADAHDSELAAKGYKEAAEAVNEIASEYARGKKLDGTDVVQGEPGYLDNARHYKNQAALSASDASTAKTNAQNAAVSAAQSKAAAEAAYQQAHQEGIVNIVNNKGSEYNTISIILRDGTTHTFSVINGSKGDDGDKGDPGESGVVTPVGAFFTLSVDANGDLYVTYPDGGTPPDFYYDSDTGDLYVDTE